MPKAKLTDRQRAILGNVWKITEEEKNLLDRFFLIKDEGKTIMQDIANNCLIHEGKMYRVRYCFPKPKMFSAALVGMSFRTNEASKFAVVCLNIWRNEGDSSNG